MAFQLFTQEIRKRFTSMTHPENNAEQEKRKGQKLTIPVAAYQSTIVTGNATIYLTLLVKFSSKKKFPTNPHAKLAPFRPKHHFGSGNPTA